MAEGFTGMAELIADLQALGPNLERESGGIVSKHAEAAAQSIRAQYPEKTGNLRRGVVVKSISPVRKRVLSRAHHAHLWERGTADRETREGFDRGAMHKGNPSLSIQPAGNVFIPTVVRWRALMKQQLVGIVRRSKVRGMTGTLEVVERGD